jgi:hypothetical protein
VRRFLMLVSVAAVAAAMYVAASSASQVSKGPTAKQFAALSKKVTALTKRVKTDETNLNTLAFAYVHCSLHSTIGIVRLGDASGNQASGYFYSPDGGTTLNLTTALDLATSGTPTYVLTPFNTSDSGCTSLIGAAARHHTAAAIARTFGLKH